MGIADVVGSAMPRPLRIQFPGAIYHLMNRGDRRESIFHDDQDRRCFLDTLGETCEKIGWHLSPTNGAGAREKRRSRVGNSRRADTKSQ